MFGFTNKKLTKAVEEGTKHLTGNVKNIAFINELKKNVGVFSAFKVHHQAEAMRALLFDKEGNRIPFASWKKEALKISSHQNVRWLRTEYNTAIKRARIGADFKEFQEAAHLYPNLEWTPSRAANPDPIHKKFWGMILPIDDPFWINNTPGDRWGCLCGLAQTKEPINRKDYQTAPQTKGLEGNPAFTGEVFSNSHAFFKGVNKEDVPVFNKEFEQLKRSIPYGKVNYKAKNGSTINIHPYADSRDLEANYIAAKIIVDELKNYKIKIAPHVEIKGIKNPEFLINNKVGDLKTFKGKNVTSLIKSAIKQDCKVIVIQLEKSSFYKSSKDVYNKINGQLKMREKHPIKQLIIIEPDKKVEIFDIKKED